MPAKPKIFNVIFMLYLNIAFWRTKKSARRTYRILAEKMGPSPVAPLRAKPCQITAWRDKASSIGGQSKVFSL